MPVVLSVDSVREEWLKRLGGRTWIVDIHTFKCNFASCQLTSFIWHLLDYGGGTTIKFIVCGDFWHVGEKQYDVPVEAIIRNYGSPGIPFIREVYADIQQLRTGVNPPEKCTHAFGRQSSSLTKIWRARFDVYSKRDRGQEFQQTYREILMIRRTGKEITVP